MSKKKFRKPMGLKLDDSVVNDQLGMSYTVGTDGNAFHRQDVRLDSAGALIVKGKKSDKTIQSDDLETVGVLGIGLSAINTSPFFQLGPSNSATTVLYPLLSVFL